MDFGGSKNAGVATGIIDGFAYLGSAASAFLLGRNLPSVSRGDSPEFVANPDNWIIWPELLMPAIVIGLILAIRIWNAKVQPKKKEDDKPSEDAGKSPADAAELAANAAKAAADAAELAANAAKSAADAAKAAADPEEPKNPDNPA